MNIEIDKALFKAKLATLPTGESFAKAHEYAQPLKGTKKYSALFTEGLEKYFDGIKAEIAAEIAAKKKAEELQAAAALKAANDLKVVEELKATEELQAAKDLQVAEESWKTDTENGMVVFAIKHSEANPTYLSTVLKMKKCKDVYVGSLTFSQYVRLTTEQQFLLEKLQKVKLVKNFVGLPKHAIQCESCPNNGICHE